MKWNMRFEFEIDDDVVDDEIMGYLENMTDEANAGLQENPTSVLIDFGTGLALFSNMLADYCTMGGESWIEE